MRRIEVDIIQNGKSERVIYFYCQLEFRIMSPSDYNFFVHNGKLKKDAFMWGHEFEYLHYSVFYSPFSRTYLWMFYKLDAFLEGLNICFHFAGIFPDPK